MQIRHTCSSLYRSRRTQAATLIVDSLTIILGIAAAMCYFEQQWSETDGQRQHEINDLGTQDVSQGPQSFNLILNMAERTLGTG